MPTGDDATGEGQINRILSVGWRPPNLKLPPVMTHVRIFERHRAVPIILNT